MKVRPSVLIEREGKALLLKYNYSGSTVYGIPGGNPDPYEPIEETVIRELQEELKLEVALKGLLLTCEVIIEEKENHTLHLIFRGDIGSQQPEVNAAETSAACFEWVAVDRLADLNIYPNIGANIQQSLTGKSDAGGIHLGKIKQQWF